MTSQGADKRILRAFYTQYVAVLLIILVFFVAAFQSVSLTKVALPESDATRAKPRFFGDVALSNSVITEGLVQDDERRLAAIAEVLKTHDVNVTVELTVPRMALSEVNNGATRAASLTEEIDRVLRAQGAPTSAVRYVIRERSPLVGIGAIARIHWLEGAHE